MSEANFFSVDEAHYRLDLAVWGPPGGAEPLTFANTWLELK